MTDIKKTFLALGLMGLLSMTPSCSFFAAGTESIQIEDVTAETLEDGTTRVTVTFVDDAKNPIVFEIPKGEQGDEGPEGNGIADVTSEVQQDGSTKVTVSFTDPDKEPQVFTIPGAVSVTGVTQTPTADGNGTLVSIQTSDGKTVEFTLAGGKDGLGIADVEQKQDEQTHDIVITITYTDPEVEPTVITLPYKNGDDGRGIESVASTTVGNTVTLHFVFTDETTQDVSFDLPTTTKWYWGARTPGASDVMRASEGDFFFDTRDMIIYQFNGRNFTQLFDFHTDAVEGPECTVVFDPGAGSFVSPSSSFTGSYTVVEGSYIPLNNIPKVYLEGYEFVGWYFSDVYDVNAGKFTNLTPVMNEEMTLYAWYVPSDGSSDTPSFVTDVEG